MKDSIGVTVNNIVPDINNTIPHAPLPVAAFGNMNFINSVINADTNPIGNAKTEDNTLINPKKIGIANKNFTAGFISLR